MPAFHVLHAERELKQLQEVCSKAGVAVVFVPELPGCAVSGAAR